jgi:hypothetical protein
MMGRHNIHTLLHASFHWSLINTASQPLISPIRELTAGSTMLHHMLNGQLFLLPQLVPHREHTHNHSNKPQYSATTFASMHASEAQLQWLPWPVFDCLSVYHTGNSNIGYHDILPTKEGRKEQTKLLPLQKQPLFSNCPNQE